MLRYSVYTINYNLAIHAYILVILIVILILLKRSTAFSLSYHNNLPVGVGMP